MRSLCWWLDLVGVILLTCVAASFHADISMPTKQHDTHAQDDGGLKTEPAPLKAAATEKGVEEQASSGNVTLCVPFVYLALWKFDAFDTRACERQHPLLLRL